VIAENPFKRSHRIFTEPQHERATQNKMEIASLRETIRNHRKKLSLEQVSDASEKLSKKIIALPFFSSKKNMAFYIANENEIDPKKIIDHARELKKTILLPIFSGQNTLTFYAVDKKTTFFNNKWGIAEPIVSSDDLVLPDKIDLFFVPLVAFDSQCNRLGRGLGCYDHYLEFTKVATHHQRPILIGLAYEFQKVDKLIATSWDVPMDYVITEKNIYRNLR